MQRGIDGMKLECPVLIWIKTLSPAGDSFWSIADVCHLDSAARLLVELLDHRAHPLSLHSGAHCSNADSPANQHSITDNLFRFHEILYCSIASNVRTP